MTNDLKRIFAENLRNILYQKHKKPIDVANDLNIPPSTVSGWINGVKYPRSQKQQELADYLGVSVTDFLSENNNTSSTIDPDTAQHYYFDKEAREIAEFLYQNPEYKVLFDASRKVKKEDILFVKQMLDRMRGDDDN